MVGSVLSGKNGILSPGESWVPRAGGLLAEREGGEVGFFWAEISGGFQPGLEGGRGLREWVTSVPGCELALHWIVEEPRRDCK